MVTPRPASGPAVWAGPDMAARSDWIHHLSEPALAALERAAERASGRALDTLTRADFDAPELARALAPVRQELASGRGFALLRGLPVGRHADNDIAAMLWGLGTRLGEGVSQSWRGDRLGHVVDRGESGRYYTRGGEIEMHMDPVDVVGLLCLRKARSGGESRIASALAVHNALLAEAPEILALLYRGFHYSRRQIELSGRDPVTGHRVPMFAAGGQGLECYFLPTAIRSAESDGAVLSEAERQALARLDAVAQRAALRLDMIIEPGDVQLLNNRLVLHARTDYVDYPEPERKRHMLRLWLMMPDWPPRPALMRLYGAGDRGLGGGIPKQPAPATP